MQFECTQDFKKPRKRIVGRFRDLERVEAALINGGLQVERLADWPEPAWNCSVLWNDVPRSFDLTLAETVAGQKMQMGIRSSLVEGALVYEFQDIDEGCRVVATADLKPQSITARVALQALTLARGKVEARLQRLLIGIVRG
jgi:hypothetical protein